MRKWKVQRDPGSELSEPMAASAVASFLLHPDSDLVWAIDDAGGRGFACEVPEIQAALLELHLPDIARLYLREPGFGPMWVGALATNVCKTDPARALALIRGLVAEASTDEDLAFVGAGPLEDLLRQLGPESIGLVEVEAAINPRFRFALAGVWPSEQNPDVWRRVTAALGDQPRY